MLCLLRAPGDTADSPLPDVSEGRLSSHSISPELERTNRQWTQIWNESWGERLIAMRMTAHHASSRGRAIHSHDWAIAAGAIRLGSYTGRNCSFARRSRALIVVGLIDAHD